MTVRRGLLRRRPSGPPAPLLSVVVPVYQVRAWLAECLDSVLGQEPGGDRSALEVVVVDDGSTDGSLAIAESYAARDPRVRLVRRPNGGLGAARNTGLEHVRGRYLTFVDSDDTIPAGAYRLVVDTLERSGSDLAVGQMVRVRDGRDAPLWWSRRLHERRRVGVAVREMPRIVRDFYTPNKVYRTDFWRRHGFRFREGVLFEDQPLVTEVYCRAGTVDVLPEVTYRWRYRDDGTSISQNLLGDDEVEQRRRAVELTAPVVAASGDPAIVAAWKWSMLQFHLPFYLTRSTPEAWPAAVAMLRAVADDADVLACTGCSPHNRVIAHLGLRGERDRLIAFSEQVADGERAFPVRWEADGTAADTERGYVELPGLDDPGLPRELFALSDWQSVGRADLREFGWEERAGGPVLRLAGRAYVDFHDPARFAATVTLVARHEPSGVEVRVPTSVDERPWTGAAPAHRWLTYQGSEFVAELPAEVLLDRVGDRRATWVLEAEVAVHGLVRRTRFGGLADPSLRRAASLVPVGADRPEWWRAGWEDDGVVVRREPARARVVQLDHGPDAVRVRIRTAGADAAYAELVTDGQTERLQLEPAGKDWLLVVPLPSLSSTPGRWRVRLCGADGARAPVTLGDRELARAGGAARLVDRTRKGVLVLAREER